MAKTNLKQQKLLEKVAHLSEALPYLKIYHGKTIVVKCGGSTLDNEHLLDTLACDIALLTLTGIRLVIVHGAGVQVSAMMTRLGLTPKFIDGQRYTDEQTMQIVQMVMGGFVNQKIVKKISKHGAKAVGLTGKDGFLLRAKKLPASKQNNLGLVGEITNVNIKLLDSLQASGFVPIIAPVTSTDDYQHTLNINADAAACAIASALKATSLLFLSDTEGILDKQNKLIAEMDGKKVKTLLKNKTIHGGMVPKVNFALKALANQVGSCRIINGKSEHPLLLELLTDQGRGTRIIK